MADAAQIPSNNLNCGWLATQSPNTWIGQSIFMEGLDLHQHVRVMTVLRSLFFREDRNNFNSLSSSHTNDLRLLSSGPLWPVCMVIASLGMRKRKIYDTRKSMHTRSLILLKFWRILHNNSARMNCLERSTHKPRFRIAVHALLIASRSNPEVSARRTKQALRK